MNVTAMSAAAENEGDSEAPLALYERALEIAHNLGMRPLAGRCHLGLGQMYRRSDKPQETREQLITATAMFREMGMRFWLEKAEAEMRELGP